jgi:hypothetical protein
MLPNNCAAVKNRTQRADRTLFAPNDGHESSGARERITHLTGIFGASVVNRVGLEVSILPDAGNSQNRPYMWNHAHNRTIKTFSFDKNVLSWYCLAY